MGFFLLPSLMECNAAIGLSGNILYLNVIMLFSLKLSLMDLLYRDWIPV